MNDGFSSDDCLYLETKAAIHYTSERRIDVTILGKRVSLQVDTGADHSVLSPTIWKSLGSPPLKQTNFIYFQRQFSHKQEQRRTQKRHS